MENAQAPVMTTKDWVITLLISFLPLIGLIMLFVWAFGSGNNPNKVAWAKAMLIWTAVGILFFVLFWSTIVGMIMMGGHSS